MVPGIPSVESGNWGCQCNSFLYCVLSLCELAFESCEKFNNLFYFKNSWYGVIASSMLRSNLILSLGIYSLNQTCYMYIPWTRDTSKGALKLLYTVNLGKRKSVIPSLLQIHWVKHVVHI